MELSTTNLNPTVANCVLAVIHSHGIQGVRVIRTDVDRIYASDTLGLLQAFCEAQHAAGCLECDRKETANLWHPGALATYRELCSPSMQVTKKPADPAEAHLFTNGIVWEIDIDYNPPRYAILAGALPHPKQILHWGEVLFNKLTGRKTSPVKLAKMLMERRGIDVGEFISSPS